MVTLPWSWPLSSWSGQSFPIQGPWGECGSWLWAVCPAWDPNPRVPKGASTPSLLMQGFLIELMREVQPTTFYGIPWMWYWMLDMVKTSQLESTRLRRRIDDWAMKMGLDTNQKRMFG